MIFSKSWFYVLSLKMIWNLLEIQRSGFVKLHEIGCKWIAHLYFINEIYAAKINIEQ